MKTEMTTYESVGNQLQELIDVDIIKRYTNAMKQDFQLEDVSELSDNDTVYNDYVSATVIIDEDGLGFVYDGRRETATEFFYMWNLSDFNVKIN